MRRHAFPITLAVLVATGACSDDDNPPILHDAQTDISIDAGGDLGVDLPGVPTDAVLVSPVGQDIEGCGSETTPCLTIAKGLTRAAAYQPPRWVAAAGGVYQETVTLKSGVHLRGGYNANFIKGGPGNTKTVIRGLGTGEAVSLVAENLAQKTIIEDLTIESPTARDSGKSSYAMVINNAPLLEVRGCALVARDGVDGVDGDGHTVAAPRGAAGKGGVAGGNWSTLVPFPPLCAAPDPPPAAGVGGMGGTVTKYNDVTCGTAGGAGGTGGTDKCDGKSGSPAGVAGSPVAKCAGAAPGAPGIGGEGGDMEKKKCQADPMGTDGSPGCDGLSGTDGPHGAGGKGRIIASYWAPTNGGDGAAGQNNATGGGGGGGGGGGECIFDCIGKCVADVGGGGGGGGSAGCAGLGGTGGTSGGGSFGALIVGSAPSIVFDACTITTGRGGRGGGGGQGQTGGKGGAPGGGGDRGLNSDSTPTDAGNGGAGGRGGDGADGGHGGGGAGGPSVGILVGSGTAPTVTQTTFTIGQAGKGGAAGGGTGKAGEDGLSGEVVNLKK